MDVTLQTLSNAATFVFIASAKGTVLVLLVLALQKLLGRWLSAQGRFLLWFPVVFALLSPTGFDAMLPASLLQQLRTDAIAVAPTFISVPEASVDTRSSNPRSPTASSLPAGNMQSLPPGPPTPSYARRYALYYLWLAGVLAVLATIAVSAWRFARLVRRAVPAPAAVQELLVACMRQTQVRTPQVTALQSGEVSVPMIAGLVTPVVLLPAALVPGLTRAQLRHVFIHELMHLKRGDLVTNWIVALAQALHWFNPAIWFAFQRMRQDRELACDAATLRYLGPAGKLAYGHTLLRLNDVSGRSAVPALAVGILESASHLKRRIHMLVQLPRPRKLQSFTATVALIPLAAVAISQPVPAPAPAALPQVVVAMPAAPTEPAPNPAAPFVPAAEPIAVSMPGAPSPATLEEARPRPARPATVEVPVIEPASLAQAPIAPEPAAPESALLAQVDLASPAEAFAFPEVEPTNVIAAVTMAQPQVAAAPATDIPRGVLQMTEEISALNSAQLRVIDEWNGNAIACEARRKDSLFGFFSKPCREVRVVQIRGDVFRFAYGCHVLGLQQQAQWEAWREALAQQQPGMRELESILGANERELARLCNLATYADEYPGFSSMLEDAVALKYYNPWYRPRFSQTTQDPYGGNYDPLIWSRMSDMPAR